MEDWKKNYWGNNNQSTKPNDWKKNYWSTQPPKNQTLKTNQKITPEFLQSEQNKLLGLNVLKTAVEQVPSNLQKSLGGMIQSFEDIPNKPFEQAIKQNNLQPINPQFQNVGQGMVQDATRQINQIKQNNQITPGSFGDTVANTVGGLIETAPSLAFSALTKNPMPVLAQTGLTSFGQTYAGNRESGADPQNSLISAVGAGALDVGTNILPFGQLVKPGASVGKKLLSQVIEQGLSNAVSEAGKSAIDKMTVNPEMGWGEAGQRIGQGAATGAAMGGLMTLGAEPFMERPVLDTRTPDHVTIKDTGSGTVDLTPGYEKSGPEPLGITFKPKGLGKEVTGRSKKLVTTAAPDLETIAPTLGKIVDYKQIKTPLRKLPSVLYQKLIDNQHFINKFTKDAGLKTASVDPYKMASNSRSVPGTVHYILGDSLVNRQGEKIGNSFKSVVDMIPKGQEYLVDDYLLHLHNIDRMNLHQKALDEANNYLTSNPDLPAISEKNIRKLEEMSRTYGRLIENAKNRLNKFESAHPEFVGMSLDELRGLTHVKVGEGVEARAHEASQYLRLINDVESFVDKFKSRGADFEGMDIKDVNELQTFLSDVGNPAWEYLNILDRAEKTPNKPVFGNEITSDISRKKVAAYEVTYPELKNIGQKYNDFMKTFMDEWGVKSGLITPELWNHLQDLYQNYVPTYRAQEEVIGDPTFGAKKKFVDPSSPIKRATGSDKPVLNPLETTMKLVDKTVKAAKYNEVGQTIVNAIRENPTKLKQWAEIVDVPETGTFDITKVAGKSGIEGVMDEHLKGYEKPKLDGKNIVRVMENGQPVYLKINDPHFLEAVTGLINYTPGTAEKIARSITSPYKALITGKNPLFGTQNLSRDIPTAYINGSIKNPFKFYANLSEAAKDMHSNSKLFQEYKALGGGESGFNLKDPSLNLGMRIKQKINPNMKGNSLDLLYKKEGLTSQYNESLESLPRFAEYRYRVLKGGNTYDAKMEGLFYANELTTNFARHGNITKAVDAFAPYLNPSVQGLDRLVRQAIKHPFATLGKGVIIITVPQVATTIMNMNNPNYQQLDNRTKDVNYLFPMWWEKDENGNPKEFIKIPKAREYGVVLADTFDRIIRTMRGEKNAFDGFLYTKGQGLSGVLTSTAFTQFAPTNPLESNILSPIITNLPSNKDFAGRTIVPQHLQRLSPQYQYDESTSELSKILGDKLGVSPKQADYLIRSYTGLYGQLVLPALTKQGNKLTPGTAIGNVVTRKFVADPLYSNNIMNEFYTKKDRLDKLRANARAVNTPITNEEMGLQKFFTKAAERISELNKQIKQAPTDEEKWRLRKQMLEEVKKYNAMVK